MITKMMTIRNLQRALNIGITGVYINNKNYKQTIFVDFAIIANNIVNFYEGKEDELKPCFIVQ